MIQSTITGTIIRITTISTSHGKRFSWEWELQPLQRLSPEPSLGSLLRPTPRAWTLTTLEELDFDRVVSGHGSVQEGTSVLKFFRSYIDELNEGVSRAVEQGRSLAEVQKSLVPERLKSLSTDQVTRLGREVAALAGPATNPAERLNGSVAANVADVYNYYQKRKK